MANRQISAAARLRAEPKAWSELDIFLTQNGRRTKQHE